MGTFSLTLGSPAFPEAREPLILRRATRQDGPLLASFLMQLSDRSRFLRYHVAWHMSQESAQREAERMLDRDGNRLTLVLQRRDRHEALAIGELASLDGATGELALVVRDDMQRQGLGTWLGRALLAAARAHGLGRVRAEVLVENRGARRLLHSLGLDRQLAAGYGVLQLEGKAE